MSGAAPFLPGLGPVYRSVPVARARGDFPRYERHLLFLAFRELEPFKAQLSVAERSQAALRAHTRDIHLRHFPKDDWYGGAAERTWRRHVPSLNRHRRLRGLAPKLDRPADATLHARSAPELLAVLAGRDRRIAELETRLGERDIRIAVLEAECFQQRARSAAIAAAAAASYAPRLSDGDDASAAAGRAANPPAPVPPAGAVRSDGTS